jgi:hypothetical protein
LSKVNPRLGNYQEKTAKDSLWSEINLFKTGTKDACFGRKMQAFSFCERLLDGLLFPISLKFSMCQIKPFDLT